MYVINFAHPLAQAQREQIEVIAGSRIERVVDVATQFDIALPFAQQSRETVDAAGLTGHEWQVLPILVNLPSFNAIAALIVAELHGRCGYFPAILRMRPVCNSTPHRFEVAEILNLQSVRDSARSRRGDTA